MSNKSSIKNEKYFVDDWLKDPLFKDWPKKDDKSVKRTRCTVCHKIFELSSAGRSNPGKGQKHNASKKVLNFLKKPPSVKQTTVEGVDAVNVESDNQVLTSSRQHTIESSCRTDTASTKTEIIWTLKSAINEFSALSNEHLNDTFGAMFLDSDDTAQQFSMGRTKSAHVRNHGLGPFLNRN